MMRDLQNSYEYRLLLEKKAIPCKYSRRRIIVANNDEITKRIDFIGNASIQNKPVKLSSPSNSSVKQNDLDERIAKSIKEHSETKSWIDDRKKIRYGLEKLGFNKSWFQNKPNKSVSENRVFKQNKKDAIEVRERDKLSSFLARSKKPRVSAAHVNCLPFLNSPLPIALAIIADYLQDNRVRLLDLFSNFDKNKDWLMTRNELKFALKKTAIPLSDAQLDELIILLDVNNDDNLSYKELAVGIEAYHQDRKWKRLKKMYDNIVDDNDSKKAVVSERMDLLQLPNIRDDSVEKRYRRHHQRRERMLRKNMPVIRESKEIVASTLDGTIGTRKLKYIEELNEESKKCFYTLQEAGVLIPHDKLKRIIIPPLDHTKKQCQNNISCERGSYPKNHLMCRQHRRKQNRLKKSISSNNKRDVINSKLPSSEKKIAPLPRVATIDYKSRAKEGRRARTERQNASPTACWPHHLLDKMRLCDDGKVHNGKSIIFNRVSS